MEKYIKLLKDKGIKDAKIINANTIVTAPWVRFKCQYGCSNFNTSWCCPPQTPNHKQMAEIVACYKIAILFSTQNINIPTEIAVEVGKEIFLDGYYKVIALGSGPCRKCKGFKTCIEHKCNFPEQAIPSMEACSIDVFRTAKNNDFDIKTLKTTQDTPHYFSIILIE